MTKEEYIKEKFLLTEQRKEVDAKLKATEYKYIKDNAPYPIGSMVKVIDTYSKLGKTITYETICIVKDYEIILDDINLVLCEYKAKGRFYYGRNAKIEPYYIIGGGKK